jgi:hypothetical protein
MQIVVEFRVSLQAYLEQFSQLVFPRPTTCPNCQAEASLVGHGFYVRHALTLTLVFTLRIKRWYCRVCHRTTSLLPSFLLRFRWYELAVIQTVVVARFEQRRSWGQLTAECSVAGAPSPRTVRRWCRVFATQAPTWLAAVQSTLAEHDPATPVLDPLGPTAGPVDPPCALLVAALHLLAWAKTRWAELAGHGPGDRLRFLWHWGYGRGLARLI